MFFCQVENFCSP